MNIFNGLKSKTVVKDTTLLRQGDACDVGFKVIKGCLKSYVLDKAGKEHILQFAPEDWFISDMDSYFNNKPATVFIDAIEDSEIVLFNKNAFASIESLEKSALIEQNNKLLRSLISTNRRLIGLLSATAEERYNEFSSIYPTLVQRLPLKLIASYIGITPEYLSEIRRKIAKK